MARLKNIHKAICRYYEIPLDSIFVKSRLQHILLPRQIFYYFASELTKLNNIEIVTYYEEESGNAWDRTTVNHSHNTIKNYIETDKEFFKDIINIHKIIDELELMPSLDRAPTKEDLIRIVLNSNDRQMLKTQLQDYLDNKF